MALSITDINVGAAADDGTGDTARVAFTAVNTNFDTIQTDVLLVDGSNTLTGDLVFAEKADHTQTPAAGKGYLWVKSDTPSSLIFTDDAGTDYDLTNVVAGSVEGTNVLSTGEAGGTKFLREDGDNTSSWQAITEAVITDLGTTVAMVADNLSVFAATTSAQLAGVISDETGTGALVFATSPTLVTPALGTPSSGNLSSCTAYEGTAIASTGEAGGTKYLREDGDGTCSWQTIAGGGAFTADGDTQISATTPIVLDQATGNEVALTLAYTTNKATSGNDTGLLVNMTDTASPGTSLLADFQVGGASKFSINNVGQLYLAENASAGADTAAYGQIWVRSDAPNSFMFTDDAGTDHKINSVPQFKSGAYTAVDRDEVYVDCSGGAVTITLPASPATNTRVAVYDSSGDSGTYNITVGRNGETIDGSAADFTIDQNYGSCTFAYNGSDWKIHPVQGAA